MFSLTLDTAWSNAAWFATTHWSVVWAAKRNASVKASIALKNLCHNPWLWLGLWVHLEWRDLTKTQDSACF